MFVAKTPPVMLVDAAVDRTVDDSLVEVAASMAAVAHTAAGCKARLVTDQIRKEKTEDSQDVEYEERYHSQTGDSLDQYPAMMDGEN